jgi:hypothetical protein
VLAQAEAGLRADRRRFVIIGLHPALTAALDDAELGVLFTIYRAACDRAPMTAAC